MKHNSFNRIGAFFLIGVLVFVVSVRAEDAQKSAAKNPAKTAKKRTTDVSFDEVLVEGKYHFADEAVTTVEGDKVVDALLNVRTDFKDRIKKSSSRH